MSKAPVTLVDDDLAAIEAEERELAALNSDRPPAGISHREPEPQHPAPMDVKQPGPPPALPAGQPLELGSVRLTLDDEVLERIAQRAADLAVATLTKRIIAG